MTQTYPTSKPMLRSALALLIFAFATTGLQAQTETKTKARPNIPGSFVVDFGINGTVDSPDLWTNKTIGSRTFNLYYQYPLRFGRSRFSFNPAIGVSMERYAWKTSVILVNPQEANLNAQVEKYDFGSASVRFNDPRKIMLVANYLEIPVEIRFDTKPEDISRSFNVAIGARGGWLYDSFIKVKYKDEGQTKKMKDKQDWGLNQFRYGVYTRLGIGGFNFFGFYNLSPLFQKDKAPSQNATINGNGTPNLTNAGLPTTMTTFTVGISINGF